MSVISTVVPPYSGARHGSSVYGGFGQESNTRGAMITTSRSERERERTVIEEPVIEHEHHHLHHHIDHGNVSSIVSRRNREYSYDDARSSVSSLRERSRHRHRHRHRGSDGVTRYSHSEVDISEFESGSRGRRRSIGSIDDDAKSDWTMIDVPPGTRRITLETDDRGFNPDSRRGSAIDLSGPRIPSRGVRRSRGMSTELWTEVTKDLCTRDAIEEMGYPYEETEFYFYIFEYLEKEQVRELIELTSYIRHERVREIEYKRRLQMADERERRFDHRDYDSGSERVTREVIHDHVTEVSYDDDRNRRRRSRYYH